MDHNCPSKVITKAGYGAALTEVWTEDDGTLWAGNGEYGSQVNFCPWCGMAAEKPIAVVSDVVPA